MSALDPGLREDLDHLRAVDTSNTARMQAIVAAHGWPGRSMVGDDGAQAAWLLVQHADHDPAFQRACLEVLGQAVQAGEADTRHHAYLTDRVLLAEGKQRRYGTEFMLAGGAWQPRSPRCWLAPDPWPRSASGLLMRLGRSWPRSGCAATRCAGSGGHPPRRPCAARWPASTLTRWTWSSAAGWPTSTHPHPSRRGVGRSRSTARPCAAAATTNEIARFRPLLERLDLTDTVVTADALHTQREHADWLVTHKHPAYVLLVKHNQPALYQQLIALPWHQVPVADRTRDRGHGRVETRRLQVTTVAGLDFPHAAKPCGSPGEPRRLPAAAGAP